MPAGPTTFARAFPETYIAFHTNEGRDYLAHLIFHFESNHSLTPRMAAEAESLLRDDITAHPEGGARAWDALNIPNGVFHVTEDATGEEFRFQIYTVQRGTLAGRRVVKVADPAGPGGWRAFAYVGRTGAFELWARFRSHSDQPYVKAAKKLLTILGRRTENLRSQGIVVTVRVQHCFICNELCTTDAISIGVCANHAPNIDPVPDRLSEALDSVEQGRNSRSARTARAAARRAAAEASAPLPDGSFRINRTTPLPLCQNGTGNVQ